MPPFELRIGFRTFQMRTVERLDEIKLLALELQRRLGIPNLSAVISGIDASPSQGFENEFGRRLHGKAGGVEARPRPAYLDKATM